MNKIPQPKIALVAGASGIIGRELVKTLLRNRWEVIGLSRHASSHPENIPFIHVDLLDAQHSAQKLHSLNGVTHIFYSAWANAGNWAEMVEPNVTMLRNLVSNIEQTAPLRTVSLMQGYKVYGAHLGPFKTPARESDPGVPGAEFNAAQLTWLSHFQRGKTWRWNAIRPGVVGSNGDIWRWCELWPRIASWFELASAPPVRLSFHQLFVDYRAHWRELAGQSLVEADILRLSDGKFADFVFGWNYDMFGDGSKLRRAGFTEMQATDDMFFRLFAQLRAARIIP